MDTNTDCTWIFFFDYCNYHFEKGSILGIFQKKFANEVISTSFIHFWYQISGKILKFKQKNNKFGCFDVYSVNFPENSRSSYKMVMIFGISILQSPWNVYSGLRNLQKILKLKYQFWKWIHPNYKWKRKTRSKSLHTAPYIPLAHTFTFFVSNKFAVFDLVFRFHL